MSNALELAAGEPPSVTPFHVVPAGGRVDLDGAAAAGRALLMALGEDPDSEHHLLSGVAHVGYLPGKRNFGLSNLARVIEHFACGLQVQERLRMQIGDGLDRLAPEGVGVVLEAEDLCMSRRGVRAGGTRTVTSSVQELIRDDASTRAEFLDLTGMRSR